MSCTNYAVPAPARHLYSWTSTRLSQTPQQKNLSSPSCEAVKHATKQISCEEDGQVIHCNKCLFNNLLLLMWQDVIMNTVNNGKENVWLRSTFIKMILQIYYLLILLWFQNYLYQIYLRFIFNFSCLFLKTSDQVNPHFLLNRLIVK